ncbi:MAG: four helix bundle protein [Kiritimatiellae bacterium]|nr:four helix bundle protein [Kiritimatiellia bacterium]
MRHRQLQIWQKGMELAQKIYHLVAAFPSCEHYALADQLRRAAVSVPSNIAEGAQRQSAKDFRHFLSISIGSLAEIDTQLELAIRLGYLEFSDELFKEIHVLERMIHAFATSVKEKSSE